MTAPAIGVRRRRGTGSGRGARGAAIAELLRVSPGGVSGTEIGASLGVSRAAVWKHVARLRARGYRIEGTPARGYRFVEAPERVGLAALEHRRAGELLGHRVHYADAVDSTNRWARELARTGAAEGTVAVADAQHAGRGRLGRRWFSPPGTNLYLSVVLRPPLPPAQAPQLTLVTACAVAATVEAAAGLRPAIKWPNDVLLGGRKIAGILAEMDSEADRVAFVIVGIGVNLNTPAQGFAGALRATATSLLAATGRAVDRPGFAARLLAELEERYLRYRAGGFAAVRREWESYSCLTGRLVTVEGPGGRRRGRVLGVDTDGALRLRAASGATLRALAGDVTLRDRGRGGRHRRSTAAGGA